MGAPFSSSLGTHTLTKLNLTGISSHVRPSRMRPARFFRLQDAAGTGVHAAPLLEEKRDIRSQALIPNIRDPFLQDRPCAGAGHNDLRLSGVCRETAQDMAAVALLAQPSR